MYSLSEWNTLSQIQKELLSGLNDETAIYGIFEPAADSSALTVKVAYREVAMLFLHFQHFNLLPHYFIISATQHSYQILTRLILDEIIQVEWKGIYVSGAAALPAIYGQQFLEEGYIPNYLSDLSLKAIYYAWTLEETDLRSIAGRLYTYNTIPWDASMKNAFENTQDVYTFLFSKMGKSSREKMQQQWYTVPGNEKGGWLSWRKNSRENVLNASSEQTYKLFISPLIHDVPEVFRHFVSSISDSEAFSFKAGGSLQGLLRPDKIVAYFYSQEALFKTAGLLQEKLEGFQPHGVPFSAQLDQKGILSHGTDPPEADVLLSTEGGSWRSFITDQLALAILQAKKSLLNWPQTMSLIRARLLTAGIDSYCWRQVH
jgi:hypothetical protein